MNSNIENQSHQRTFHKLMTPHEVTTKIKWIIDAFPDLNSIWIEGEISNLKYYSKGNQLYFNLCDSNAQLNCVVFSNILDEMSDKPKNGEHVQALGRIHVYPKRGAINLHIYKMYTIDKGVLKKQLKALQLKLEKEGIFHTKHKKRLPALCENIGIITSINSAAQNDICSILSKKAPCIKISIYPSIMQGINASKSVIEGLKTLDSHQLDAIIIARGGGGMEDLNCFNEETLIRRIAVTVTPIISAIGHETDTTLCDFVSDYRCETPSASASLICEPYIHMRNALKFKVQRLCDQIHSITSSQAIALCNSISKLKSSTSLITNNTNQTFQNKTNILGLNNPIRHIQNGYLPASTPLHSVINSIHQVTHHETITLHLKDGKIKTKVIKITHSNLNV